MSGFFPSSSLIGQRPAGLVPKCGACGLYKKCESPKMPVYGSGRRQVLVVGEAPGETEDARGRPFIGKAGQFLRDTLESIGVDLDRDAWTTNSLICRPPKNATPTAQQIDFCRPNLLSAITKYDPRVIVTLGRSALAGIIATHWKGEVGPLERWVGWRIPMASHSIFPTYHPSYLMRMQNPFLDRLFARHLRRAFAPWPVIKEEPEDLSKLIEVILDPEEAAARMEDLSGSWLAVDYETNCLKPEYPKARIVSCAVSDGRITLSYPWEGAAIRKTRELVLSKKFRKIAANLRMEERWTRKEFGEGVENWGWDTVLAAHCLDNRQAICSLKFQSLVRLGVPTYNDQVERFLLNHRGHYNRIDQIELETLLLYGGMDALLEYRLAMKQREDMGYED